VAILHDARLEDRHSIDEQLGIRLTYHPGKHEIRVEASLHPDLLAEPNGPKFGQTVSGRGGICTVSPNSIVLSETLPLPPTI
jgi:hypothetical protein